MDGINLGQIFILAGIFLSIFLAIIVTAGILKNQLSFSLLAKFFAIFAIGLLCAMIPMGPLGLFFGWPAVLFNSIVLCIVFRKDLTKTITTTTEGTKN